ncbi:hypothetical protein WJ438_05650 [Streptomyces sp. GD-15H]
MHDERRRIEGRVECVHAQRVKPAVYAATVPLTVEARHAPGEPVPFAQAAAASYEPFARNSPWGPPWGTTWFRMRGPVPAAWPGASRRSSTSASPAPGRASRLKPWCT